MPFPNVPDLPGVPPLARKIGTNVAAAAPLVAADISAQFPGALSGLSSFLFGTPPTWGVFQNGKLFLQPDSFLGIRYRNENRVSDYPVEEGAFSTYNKVQTPFDATISLSKGGNAQDRAKFLLNVEHMFNDMKLYTVITPELTYSNLTVTDYTYERRSRNGAHFIVTHIRFLQVRILPNPGVYSSPTATPAKYQGQVSPLQKITPKLKAASALTPILSW